MIWTPEALLHYVDEQLKRQREAIALALDASKTAALSAERAQELWKTSQNEWRTTVGDITALGMTRKEWELAHQTIVREIEAQRRALETHLADYQGSKAAWARMTTVAGVCAALGGALVAVLHYLTVPK